MHVRKETNYRRQLITWPRNTNLHISNFDFGQLAILITHIYSLLLALCYSLVALVKESHLGSVKRQSPFIETPSRSTHFELVF